MQARNVIQGQECKRMKVWMSIKMKSIGVRGDSRVNRDRGDICLFHEPGKYQSRKTEPGYKRQTSLQSADTPSFPESVHLRCVFLILWVFDRVHLSVSVSASDSTMEVCG